MEIKDKVILIRAVVRGISFLGLIIALCILAYTGKVQGGTFIGVALIAIKFYFDDRDSS